MTFSEAIQFLLPYRSVEELVGKYYQQAKTEAYHDHFLQMHSEPYLGVQMHVPLLSSETLAGNAVWIPVSPPLRRFSGNGYIPTHWGAFVVMR